jgi:23S rRNA (pseudouridine1915-N3)-methyltransferase
VKLSLLSVGKTRQAHIKDGLSLYLKRLSHSLPTELVEIPDIRTGKRTQDEIKDLEAQRLLAAVPAGARVVALDEHGRQMSSRNLAQWLQEQMNRGESKICLLIGGPYGHGQAVLDRADLTLSLSKMTFPHDLARLVLVEQLYRASTILRNEPYHHD